MSMTDAILKEFDIEAGTTRRVLERVPDDKLAWKPHPKSMSLGELALHTAMVPGYISTWAQVGEFACRGQMPPEATSTAAIRAAHDAGAQQAKEIIGGLGDAGLPRTGKASPAADDLSMPKAASCAPSLQPLVYHRGQLPCICGCSTCRCPRPTPERRRNPFAAHT